MGMWERIKGKEERPRIKAAVIGAGPEAELLASAYELCPGIELVGSETAVHADGVVRAPVMRPPGLDRFDDLVRTPGLKAVEIVAPTEARAALAADSIKAGLFTSLEVPAAREDLVELGRLSEAYHVQLRLRLLPLYYPPYREVKRLLREDAVGRAIALKLMVRRGKGTALPDPLDPGPWIREHELGFLALAPWLLGPVEKVYARLPKSGKGETPISALLMWKHTALHQYGHLQVDFCPGLHVRTFTQPVHRALEITGIGGLIMATRGEGQLLRMPSLIVRGKSTTTSFEMVPDDWREVYKGLARETVDMVAHHAGPEAGTEAALMALDLVGAAARSAAKSDEVAV
jgi:predicted dehydrogenase